MFFQRGGALLQATLGRYRFIIKPFHMHSYPLLAGHSKWANIKHTKAEKDGERAAQFVKLARQIRFAIQEGGSNDPLLNSQLKSAIELAVRSNMPMATIQNNIKRQNKTELKKYRLELRLKQAFIVCVMYTDNFAMLKMDISTLVRKAGASFIDAAHMFDDFGAIEATAPQAMRDEGAITSILEDLATEDAIECGAEEVEVIDAEKGLVNFICNPIQLHTVQKSLGEKGYAIDSVEHIYAAKVPVTLPADEVKTYATLVKKLRDLPGIEDIFDNVDNEDILV